MGPVPKWKTNSSPVQHVALNSRLRAKNRNFTYPRDSRNLKNANLAGMRPSRRAGDRGAAMATEAATLAGHASCMTLCAQAAAYRRRCLSSQKAPSRFIAENASTPAGLFPRIKPGRPDYKKETGHGPSLTFWSFCFLAASLRLSLDG